MADKSKTKEAADALMTKVGETLKDMLEQKDGSQVLTVQQRMAVLQQSLAWIKLSDARSNDWGKMFSREPSEGDEDSLGAPILEAGESSEDVFAEEEDEPGNDLASLAGFSERVG